jgi:hypothetical protein
LGPQRTGSFEGAGVKADLRDPQTYVSDVIAKIVDDWPAKRWDELIP